VAWQHRIVWQDRWLLTQLLVFNLQLSDLDFQLGKFFVRLREIALLPLIQSSEFRDLFRLAARPQSLSFSTSQKIPRQHARR